MSDNPFRIDPIILLMLEEADVEELKILREMDAKWNYMAVVELEKRATKLLLKPADFSCGENREDFLSFMKDTKSNSQLFQSFKFFYPECLEFFDLHFLTDYTPKVIGLKIDKAFKFNARDIKYLHNFFKINGPELQEFEIEVCDLSEDDSSTDEEGDEAPFSLPTKSGKQLMLPKLTKFAFKNHRACGADNSVLINLFKFILDKSVDPTPNLINLEINSRIRNFYNTIGLNPLAPNALDRWTRLTRLTIHTLEQSDVELTTTMVTLGKAGMSLEHLDLPIYGPCIMERPNLSLISTNYSHFFHIQSKSLKILIFRCNFEQMGDANKEELIKAQIQLPVFENLHTFKLKIDSCGRARPLVCRIFKLGLFPVHFPKLETLKTFNQEVLSIMFPEDTTPEPIPLRFLKIWIWTEESRHWEGWKDGFGDKIRSIENFKCQGMILDDEEDKEIPWVESLKVLEIYQVKSPLKLGYLNNLRELIVIESCLPKPREYLPYFEQIRSLNLSAITFKFKWGQLSKRDRAKIINFFPFTVIFTKI